MAEDRIVSLHGKWQVSQVGGKVSLQGNVPGLVHHDLIEQGIVGDPFSRMNEADQQWVGDATWEYSRTFVLNSRQAARGAIILNCDSLDTLAEVFVNDHKVAATDNMFVRWRWSIKDFAREGENNIRIVFKPVNPVMKERGEAYHLDLKRRCFTPWGPAHRNLVRKSPCHGDWDWGPCFLTQGIPQDIYIECRDGGRLLYVNNLQEHNAGRVSVTLRAFIDMPRAAKVRLTFDLGGQVGSIEADLEAGETRLDHTLTVENPRLWWPNGYGPQSLYALRVELESEGENDVVDQEIGLRRIELVTEDDEAGQSFYFRVNGLAVFAKGANWIPTDSFETRVTDESLAWELESAAAAHHNMIRIWGGGLYESERFYRMCDRMGIMVWQECIFACGYYPVNPEFLDSVRLEVRHQVRRIAAHASLALWCGNNEIEQLFDRGRPDFDTLLVEYDQLFIQTIMPIVNAEAPQVTYWPSSASNGVREFGNPQDESRGDVHFWEVWHGGKPASRYLEVKPRFSSEFGFQSFSSPDLMDRYTLPEDRNVCSRVLDFHQRNARGSGQIFTHIPGHFKSPVGYENTVYISQALQALSLKVACEHWYRIKPHNMGNLIWQLNDIWPVTSWASLEYDGGWKILHYYEKRFYAPLLVSTVEHDGRLEVWGTSEVNGKLTGTLRVRVLDFDGRELFADERDASLSAMQSKVLASFDRTALCPAGHEEQRRFVAIDLDCGEYTSRNEHFFSVFKYLDLKKPCIRWDLKVSGDEVTMAIQSDTLAPFVWIRTGGIPGRWSDNGMHLRPAEEQTVVFYPRRETTPGELKPSIVMHDLYSAAQG